MDDFFVAPTEFKFTDDAQPGAFEGYGAVFGNVDAHGDVITPGAFSDSLAEHKAKGTMPALFVEHSGFKGGDPLPVGTWTDIAEDGNGLRVKGRISALDTDHGRRIRALMHDGALRGLSIAFHVPGGGSVMGKRGGGEPRRTLTRVDLHGIDIVRDPSNALARIDALKSAMAVVDHGKAIAAIAAAIHLHRQTMGGSDAPTAAERAQLLLHLQDVHTALTGQPFPGGKSAPTTIREFEAWLQEKLDLSNSKARAIAERGFKAAQGPRDEEAEHAAAVATKEALDDVEATLAGFSLPTF